MTYSPGTPCTACNRGTLYDTYRLTNRTVPFEGRQFQIQARVPAYGCGSCDVVFYDNRADDAVQLVLAQQIAAEQLKLEKCYSDLPPVMGFYLKGQCYEQFVLPTEMVLHNNSPIPPEAFVIGRAYRCDLEIAEDDVIRHRYVVDSVRGMESHQQESLLVVEVWANYGDDGHTVYTHRGWMIARKSTFSALLKRYRDNTETWSRDERDFLDFIGGKSEPF